MTAEVHLVLPSNILIADSRPENVELAASLRAFGIHCQVLPCTGDVMATCEMGEPDILLLSADAPEVASGGLAHTLQQLYPSLPLILLDHAPASEADPLDDIERFQAPFQLRDIVARIKTCLRIRKAHRKMQFQNDALQTESRFRAQQNHLLEMIATHQPLDAILSSLIAFIEAQGTGMLATVQVLDDSGQVVRRVIAPSLPATYANALAGMHVRPDAGSCGTAMYRRRTVVVSDIQSDPLWDNYRGLVEPYALRACWSTPITASNRRVLGSFAMYYREVRSPTDHEVRLLELATHIAGIAIERYETERRIGYMARHDALTGLPNRVLLEDRIGQAIARARRLQQGVGVLFIDLDHFKHVNDSLGHRFGDKLLVAISERLRGCLRSGDTVARLGGDEFVICLPDLSLNTNAATVAEKVLESLALPLELEGREFDLSGSIGISVFPGDGDDAEALLRAADTAMYHAKSRGRGQFQFFTRELNEAAHQRLKLQGEMRQAVSRGEFLIHYQPQVSLKTGRIVGAEALLRWRHPERGLLPPTEFVPHLEESALIVSVGAWAVREICLQARAWLDAGLPPIQVAINLSARQFQRGNIVQTVADALQESGMPANLLELEFTESVVFEHTESVIHAMQQLKHMGASLTLDDFGTGYSSLAYLKRFPVDRIKIDQAFVADIAEPNGSAPIVRSILDMARNVSVTCVAEGVENQAQLGCLQQFGCAEMQGYLFSAPLSADSFAAMLLSQPQLPLLHPHAADTTLLVADNNPETAGLLRQLLRREGVQVLDVSSRNAVFSLLAEQPAGVLITGLDVGGDSGVTLLNEASVLYPNLIGIVLADADDPATMMEVINQSGHFKVLTRPWDNTHMVEHVRTAFRWHQALANARAR